MSEDPAAPPGRPSVVAILGLACLGLAVLGLSGAVAWTIRSRQERRAAHVAGNPVVREKTGRLLFQVHCARCHGPDGKGDGPDAPYQSPPPRALSSAPRRFGTGPDAIRKVIVEGIPGTGMAARADLFSPPELDALVAHVQSLAPTGTADDSPPSSPLTALLNGLDFHSPGPKEPAPAIAIDDLEGARHALEDWRGKLTLLVFWGTTCGPCLEELPGLERLADEFQSRGLGVVPLCVDESDPAVVRKVARGRAEHLPVYLARDDSARLRYDVQALPVAALIDRDGRLLGIARGVRRWDGEETRRLVGACLDTPRTGGPG